MRVPVAAAVKTSDGIVHFVEKPGRHHHVVHGIFRSSKQRGVQGFVMSDGTFADRREAAAAAIESGLISELPHPPNLYSEDLW